MFSQTILVALLAAVTEARFSQEQGNGAIAAIGQLTNLGKPGQAATLSGNSIQFLLAAANPCGKLTQADNIIKELGTSTAAVAAARGLVAAEQNFNPNIVSIPSICSDATLPQSEQLRGVVPLIDPAVGGHELENANSKKSITTPFDAKGLSVAQVMIAQGFSNFTAVDPSGKKTPASQLGGSGSGSSSGSFNATSTSSGSSSGSKGPGNSGSSSQSSSSAKKPKPSCSGKPSHSGSKAGSKDATSNSTVSPNTSSPNTSNSTGSTSGSARDPKSCTGSGQTMVCPSPAIGAGKVVDPIKGNFDGFVKSTIAGLDFGLCVPTMKFELGLDGRKATAGTFQAQDPLCNKGQEEALNPAIITNRIHDQMTNACGANQAAKDAIKAAEAKIVALGTRNSTTAQAFNTALGFDGVNINPDNAPQPNLIGHDS